jgi:hypothetical protein
MHVKTIALEKINTKHFAFSKHYLKRYYRVNITCNSPKHRRMAVYINQSSNLREGLADVEKVSKATGPPRTFSCQESKGQVGCNTYGVDGTK